MLRVAYLHFTDDTGCEPRSGWYICDALGAIVAGTGRFEHQASAVRAVSVLVNAPVLA